MTTTNKRKRPDRLARLVSAALADERAEAFKRPAKRLSKRTVDKILAAPKCTSCDDTGIAVYPLRLCGDCDAGKNGAKP